MAAGDGDTSRKLIVEVVEARDLLPKDGVGTCSSYVVVDFNGQRKRTPTVHRSLNPSWNEALEFDAEGIDIDTCAEQLEVDVLHDKRVGPSRIRNNFLGRLRLDSKHFVKKDEEALMHFPLQKKSFFSWVRGDIGLRIYYVDVPVPVPVPEPPPPPPPPPAEADKAEKPEAAVPAAEPAPQSETTEKSEERAADEAAASPEKDVPLVEEANAAGGDELYEDTCDCLEPDEQTKAPAPAPLPEADASSVAEAHETEAAVPPSPPPPPPHERIPTARTTDRSTDTAVMEKSSFDLVEKMQYLFVRIVRARSLPKGSKPVVHVSSSGRQVSTGVARKVAMFFDWEEIFAFPRQDQDASMGEPSSLEVSVWDTEIIADGGEPLLLGGICFDTPDIPIRDPPDSPLATQWYRLEGGGARRGDLMLAAWMGTQADETYHDATKADDINLSSHVNTRSKVYLSPKLWYLRITVIEAQDLTSSGSVHSTSMPVSVKAALGFQSVRTRFASGRNGSPSWGEDLILVGAEPFGDQKVVLTLEVRQSKDQPAASVPTLGSTFIPLTTIERRVDDRLVTSRWLAVDPPVEEKNVTVLGVHGAPRLHVRACFDGGYHVTDEPAYAASDYRPSAKQLWKQQLGKVELGVIRCKGLLPMKTVQGKGSTDAYVVAKYGQKWARTRTIAQALDPAWNEQYTWSVYDPSTVLTVGVFDDDGRQPDGQNKGGFPSRPIGRVRIRISTLECGRVYRTCYPLMLLLPTGMKRMGEVEVSVRFSRSVSSMDLVHVYGQPTLPAMHHLRPIPPSQREHLRSAAARIVVSHLSRSDPPLRREVVMYLLESDSSPRYSMRKVRTNWNRIVASLSWAVDIARWADNTRAWRNPTATLLAHGVLVLLVWYPDLLVPAVALHVSAVGIWKYRTRPCGPARKLWEASSMADHAAGATAEEIDEELDTVPSSKGFEVVRGRYDRLRLVAGRVQGLLGDVAAHGERVQALVSWRDPRATGIFVVICFLVSVLLYVVPSKVMVVGMGFYYMRHPMFRDRMPPPALNFFRRLPSLSDGFL